MQIGILGFKFTGKTTLFNAVTGASLPTGQGGVEPHLAVGRIPDPRLEKLTAMFKPKREVHATVEWVDVPGFEPSGAAGPGEGTRFLEHARRVDALAQVVRCFDNGVEPPDPAGGDRVAGPGTGPGRPAGRREPDRQAGQGEAAQGQGRPAAGAAADGALPGDAERRQAPARSRAEPRRAQAHQRLLPAHAQAADPGAERRRGRRAAGRAARPRATTGAEVVDLCAKVEAELAELSPQERSEFLADLGIAEPAAHRMVRSAYRALGLHSFFTVGEDECRAWTLRRGALAPEAAGVIHSDLERGFIRAETVAYEDLDRGRRPGRSQEAEPAPPGGEVLRGPRRRRAEHPLQRLTRPRECDDPLRHRDPRGPPRRRGRGPGGDRGVVRGVARPRPHPPVPRPGARRGALPARGGRHRRRPPAARASGGHVPALPLPRGGDRRRPHARRPRRADGTAAMGTARGPAPDVAGHGLAAAARGPPPVAAGAGLAAGAVVAALPARGGAGRFRLDGGAADVPGHARPVARDRAGRRARAAAVAPSVRPAAASDSPRCYAARPCCCSCRRCWRSAAAAGGRRSSAWRCW